MFDDHGWKSKSTRNFVKLWEHNVPLQNGFGGHFLPQPLHSSSWQDNSLNFAFLLRLHFQVGLWELVKDFRPASHLCYRTKRSSEDSTLKSFRSSSSMPAPKTASRLHWSAELTLEYVEYQVDIFLLSKMPLVSKGTQVCPSTIRLIKKLTPLCSLTLIW